MKTHIKNIENYTQFEVAIPDNSIFDKDQSNTHIFSNTLISNLPQKTLIMGEYFTIATDLIYTIINVQDPVHPPGRPGFNQYLIGIRYNLYQNEMLLYRFEIVSDSHRKFIRLIDESNAIVGEIVPTSNLEIYFAITDDKIDDFVIKNYRSKVAVGHWGYHTGFIIEINGEEYGILAFYPNLRLYKNKTFTGIIDEEQERRIILYTFMAYKRLKQPDIYEQQDEPYSHR